MGIDLLDRAAPPLRLEVVGVRAPGLAITPGCVGVIADIGARRDWDPAAEQYVLGGFAVDDLGGWREETEALVDDRGQVR